MSKQFDKHEHLKHIPPGTRFDDTEPRSGLILIGAIVTIAAIIVTIGGVYSYYSWYREKVLFERQLAPNSVELSTIRSQEDQLLNSYAFVEKSKDIVRLPVSRAIDLVVAESAEGNEKYPVAAKIIPPPKADEAPAVPGSAPPPPVDTGIPIATKPKETH